MEKVSRVIGFGIFGVLSLWGFGLFGVCSRFGVSSSRVGFGSSHSPGPVPQSPNEPATTHCHWSLLTHEGALIARIGFGILYTIVIKRNPPK